MNTYTALIDRAPHSDEKREEIIVIQDISFRPDKRAAEMV
jgi:hypothetical protein